MIKMNNEFKGNASKEHEMFYKKMDEICKNDGCTLEEELEVLMSVCEDLDETDKWNEETKVEEYKAMELKDISNTDVMYYLEEMINMGDASEIEMNVYYDIKLTGKCKGGELKRVKKNMLEMYDEKF